MKIKIPQKDHEEFIDELQRNIFAKKVYKMVTSAKKDLVFKGNDDLVVILQTGKVFEPGTSICHVDKSYIDTQDFLVFKRPSYFFYLL